LRSLNSKASTKELWLFTVSLQIPQRFKSGENALAASPLTHDCFLSLWII